MMFTYAASRAERAAERLLRAKGWRVQEPTCPICNGWGTVSEFASWKTGGLSGGSLNAKPCPNGCERPATFLHSGTAISAAPRPVTADGTQGMSRGVR